MQNLEENWCMAISTGSFYPSAILSGVCHVVKNIIPLEINCIMIVTSQKIKLWDTSNMWKPEN